MSACRIGKEMIEVLKKIAFLSAPHIASKAASVDPANVRLARRSPAPQGDVFGASLGRAVYHTKCFGDVCLVKGSKRGLTKIGTWFNKQAKAFVSTESGSERLRCYLSLSHIYAARNANFRANHPSKRSVNGVGVKKSLLNRHAAAQVGHLMRQEWRLLKRPDMDKQVPHNRMKYI